MMQIDTSAIPRWEGRTVVLEFQHGKEDRYPDSDGRRSTSARLVEIAYELPTDGRLWLHAPRCWKRTVAQSGASCSPEDQYCRETGRRIAIRRLNDLCRGFRFREGKRIETGLLEAPLAPLAAAAIRQYFEARARLAA